jgi:formamidopyrimidine-DNA glycosylase
MPELPEVEHVARQLRESLVGHTIVGARVFWPRAIASMEAEDFVAHVVGRQVTGIGRRAKYLLVTLDGGDVLVVHRRMSGNLVFAAPGEDYPYTRVELVLDDGRRLLYTDPRKFGRLALIPEEQLPASFAALGPEPLENDFTPQLLAERLAGRQRPIKAVLMDQAVVAGLGNIYADEALFRAGIHPLRPAASLTADEIVRLHAGIQGALRTGIEHGGTTFGRHRDVYNEAGVNLEHVEVYRRTGQPCVRCGSPVERIVVAQRGTHFCPHCQPAR